MDGHLSGDEATKSRFKSQSPIGSGPDMDVETQHIKYVHPLGVTIAYRLRSRYGPRTTPPPLTARTLLVTIAYRLRSRYGQGSGLGSYSRRCGVVVTIAYRLRSRYGLEVFGKKKIVIFNLQVTIAYRLRSRYGPRTAYYTANERVLKSIWHEG